LGERELKGKLEAIGQEEILRRKVEAQLEGCRGIDRAEADELRLANQKFKSLVSG
jgi:hypothetical protein